MRERNEGAAWIVEHLPREHPTRQWKRGMAAGRVDGARVIAIVAEKKRAAAVPDRRERAARRLLDDALHDRQPPDNGLLAGIEGNRPPGTATCA